MGRSRAGGGGEGAAQGEGGPLRRPSARGGIAPAGKDKEPRGKEGGGAVLVTAALARVKRGAVTPTAASGGGSCSHNGATWRRGSEEAGTERKKRKTAIF